jgi:hypothetical protein
MRIMKRSLYIQSGEPATYLKKLIKLRHSVAFRLTIWYAGFFAISLLVALAALYFIPLHGFRGANQHLLDELREKFRWGLTVLVPNVKEHPGISGLAAIIILALFVWGVMDRYRLRAHVVE